MSLSLANHHAANLPPFPLYEQSPPGSDVDYSRIFAQWLEEILRPESSDPSPVASFISGVEKATFFWTSGEAISNPRFFDWWILHDTDTFNGVVSSSCEEIGYRPNIACGTVLAAPSYLPRGWENIRSSDEPVFRNIAFELRRLDVGDASSDIGKPAENVINNIEQLQSCLTKHVDAPEVEIDESSGSVTLVWIAANKRASFSLVFTNSDMVLGVSSNSGGQKVRPWKLKITARKELVKALASSQIPAVQDKGFGAGAW
jgi:hypothetical protein